MKLIDLQQVNSKAARLTRLTMLLEDERKGPRRSKVAMDDLEEQMTELNSQLTLLGVDMEIGE